MDPLKPYEKLPLYAKLGMKVSYCFLGRSILYNLMNLHSGYMSISSV